MDVDLTQTVLKGVFPKGEAAAVSIERIQELVRDRFSVSLGELTGGRRSQSIVYPRQVDRRRLLARAATSEVAVAGEPRPGRLRRDGQSAATCAASARGRSACRSGARAE
jgi:hypothetical protein